MRVAIYTQPDQDGERLKTDAEQVLEQLGVDGKVRLYSSDFDCACAGVMFTPAISINGRLISNGWVPIVEDFKQAIVKSLG